MQRDAGCRGASQSKDAQSFGHASETGISHEALLGDLMAVVLEQAAEIQLKQQRFGSLTLDRRRGEQTPFQLES